MDLVTIGAAAGMSAWLADKLPGPSAEAVGEQVRTFASARLTKIFSRTQELSGGEITAPLPPGFAYLAIQRASFSEDSDEITDMWAALLLDASSSYSHRHANYADILSQLGSREVNILNQLVPTRVGGYPPWQSVNFQSSLREDLRSKFTAVSGEDGQSHDDLVAETQRRFDELLQIELGWPGRITAVSYPYHYHQSNKGSVVTGGTNFLTEYDVLIRQRLIERFSFDLSQSFSSPYVEGILVTALGVAFVATCRGDKN